MGERAVRGGFLSLRILDTRPETQDATSVLFEIPPTLQEVFCWRAGQHVTLRFFVEGEEERRSYSISEMPAAGGRLRITVKRVRGGLISNYINERVAPGDTIEVMPPFGGFCLVPNSRERRTYYFLGAGSGITPLYAMIRTVLAAEPHSTAHLAYGNTDESTIIFRDALARLEEEYGGRLTVKHILSSPSWKSALQYWRRGRIDAECVAALINECPPYAQDTQYYVCGPGDMNAVVRTSLLGLDVPGERIHMESFGNTTPPDDSVVGVAAAMSVRLNGKVLTVHAGPGQTILNAVRTTGNTPPFSCESGVCGACRAQLRNGSVHLRARMALTDAEVDQGVILTCQALSTTPKLTVEYD